MQEAPRSNRGWARNFLLFFPLLLAGEHQLFGLELSGANISCIHSYHLPFLQDTRCPVGRGKVLPSVCI